MLSLLGSCEKPKILKNSMINRVANSLAISLVFGCKDRKNQRLILQVLEICA